MKKEKARQWEDEPLLLDAKDLQRIMRINRNHIYELFHQESFPSIRIGRRFCVEKNNFREWLQQQSWKNEFISKHNVLNNDKKKIFEQAFWEAVTFLRNREADNIDRKEKITELFSKT